MTKAERAAYRDKINAMRKHWTRRVRPMVKGQLAPTLAVLRDNLHGAHPERIVVNVHDSLESNRQAWNDLLTAIAHQVGEAMADYSVKDLDARSGLDGFSTSNRMYTATRDTFLSTYCAQTVPGRVDRIIQGVYERVAHKLDEIAVPATKSVKANDDAALVAIAEPEYIPEDLDAEFLDMFGNFEDFIAESEVFLAGNLGPLAGVVGYSSAMGVELVKCWESQNDERTRHSHRNAQGQCQVLSDPFEVGESLLMFPMDSSMGAGAEETDNCRCVETFDLAGV